MTQELAKKGNQELAEGAPAQASQALRSDLIAPKLLLMQGLSDLVSEGKARQGDIVKSLTGEKVGDTKTPVEFIPLAMQNSWIIQEEINGKYEYRKTVPRRSIVLAADVAAERNREETDKQADDSSWEFNHLGSKWKRVKVINVYGLLPADIKGFQAEIAKALESGEMPDLDKALLPVMIPFRNTSYGAGRKVATHFAKAQEMAKYGARPYGYALKLTCALQENDKGKFFVYDIDGNRKCTSDELAEAAKLVGDVEAGKVKVHEVDEEGAPAPGAKKAPTEEFGDQF